MIQREEVVSSGVLSVTLPPLRLRQDERGGLDQAFPDKEQRNRAVGWWGAAEGIAMAAGPVVGSF